MRNFIELAAGRYEDRVRRNSREIRHASRAHEVERTGNVGSRTDPADCTRCFTAGVELTHLGRLKTDPSE